MLWCVGAAARVLFLASGARKRPRPAGSLPLAKSEQSHWDSWCRRPWSWWQLGRTGSPAAGFAGADPGRARAVLPVWGAHPLLRARLLLPLRSDRQVAQWGQAPQPWDTAKPQLPLQSLWHSLREAGGEKKTFPQLKAQTRSESWSLYCRSPEREGGAGFELPAALSCSTKQPPSLASEIQREVLKL